MAMSQFDKKGWEHFTCMYVIVHCKVPDNFNDLWQVKKKVYIAYSTTPIPKKP